MSDGTHSPEFRELFRVIAERSPSDEDELFGPDEHYQYYVCRNEPDVRTIELDIGAREFSIIAFTEIANDDIANGLVFEYYLCLGGEVVRRVAGTNNTSLLDNRQIAQTTEKLRNI